MTYEAASPDGVKAIPTGRATSLVLDGKHVLVSDEEALILNQAAAIKAMLGLRRGI